MLGYRGLAVVGEMHSDVVMCPWLLLVGLSLPFAIWLSLVLVGIVVSGVCSSCGPVSLCPYSLELKSESTARRSLSPARLCTEDCGVSWLPSANGGEREDFCPSCSSDLRPCVLLAGSPPEKRQRSHLCAQK